MIRVCCLAGPRPIWRETLPEPENPALLVPFQRQVDVPEPARREFWRLPALDNSLDDVP